MLILVFAGYGKPVQPVVGEEMAPPIKIVARRRLKLFVSPKTKSSQRMLPISSALRRVLETHRARMNPTSPGELVFQTPKGTPLSDKNLYNRELAPGCDRIGSLEFRGTRSGTDAPA